MDTKSIAELKPCPFCGKPAWYDWNNDGNAKDLGCSDDDCAGHLVFSIWHTDIGTKHESEAIEAWNKRAADKEIATIKNDLDRQIAVWQSDARAWQKTVSTRDAELARLREALEKIANNNAYFMRGARTVCDLAREALKSNDS